VLNDVVAVHDDIAESNDLGVVAQRRRDFLVNADEAVQRLADGDKCRSTAAFSTRSDSYSASFRPRVC